MTQNFAKLTSDNIISFIEDIFKKRAEIEYLGEPVTTTEHMLQAATIAEREGMNEDLIVGAFLHDIGHFTNDLGTFMMEDKLDRCHEKAGAAILLPFFPSVVTDCVRYHVAAKRYICAIQPEYFKTLSDASVHSLKLQGGPMNKQEVEQFAIYPNVNDIVQVRYCDDKAKEPNAITPNLDYFLSMTKYVMDKHHNV